MTAKTVLFLALGGDRQRLVIQDSAQVVEDGGRAVVIVDDLTAWPGLKRIANRVKVFELPALQAAALPTVVARKALYGLPRRVYRRGGRLPLMSWSRPVGEAYERRIADVIHARLFLPTYEWLRGDNRHRLIRRLVLAKTAFDVVVICDPQSIPVAARLARRRSVANRIAYDLDAPLG